MSTRAMVALQRWMNGNWELFYRHVDGNPAELGIALMKMLKTKKKEIPRSPCSTRPMTIEERILDIRGVVASDVFVDDPVDAFLKIQGDLEWVYAISDHNNENTSIQIYKTSNPDFLTVDRSGRTPNRAYGIADDPLKFVFRAWFSYMRFLPNNWATVRNLMEEVERTCDITMACLQKHDEAVAEAKAKQS